MIIAIILLGAALLASSVYAAVLHTRLQASKSEAERLRGDDERFRAVAARMLDESRRSLSEDTARRMTDLLDPLRRNIESFNRTIDEKYTREASERFALREKIDELHRLNLSLGLEAKQLADALRGNGKVQGDWGEMILTRLLEQAGFSEGREFETQSNFKDPEGGANRRPDVLVRFPDNGCVVIDSKASLTAYVNLCAAESDADRQAASAAHVLSVRNHVRELAAKNYQDFVGTDRRLDFVLMFIPNEGAYLAALQAAPELWQEAYDKRVLIISPTHLFSVLKMVQQMWRHDDQSRHAAKIAVDAGNLYDKFVGFVADMTAVESKLNQAMAAHQNAMRKLHTGPGNIVRRIESLRTMGAKATKSLSSDLLDKSEDSESAQLSD